MASKTKFGSAKTKGKYVRGLSVSEEAFLLLKLLHFLFVGAAGDEVVDVEQVPFSRDVETGILLPDATVTARGERSRGRCSPHALRSWPRIHLLLVECHPFGVGVWGHWLLGGRRREDRAGPHIALDGHSMEGHLLRLRDEGWWARAEISRSERVQRFGGSRRPRAGVLLDGPCLLAVAGSLICREAGEGVVALLGEEGVVGVGVNDRAGGGSVNELAGREVLPDGGVWGEDALGGGGGRHEDGGVQDAGVECVGVVKGEGRGFPVDVTEGRRRAVEVHGVGVVVEVHGGLF